MFSHVYNVRAFGLELLTVPNQSSVFFKLGKKGAPLLPFFFSILKLFVVVLEFFIKEGNLQRFYFDAIGY